MKKMRRQAHGVALMLVLAVIAVASLIGLTMLSAASLQAQVAGNYAQSATADYMAESAIQTASYYLQRDRAHIPASWTITGGYAIRAQNITVTGVAGSFDISAVATTITDEYQITATGRSDGTSPVTRTAAAKIRVLRTSPAFASGFGGTSTTIGINNYFNGGPLVYSGSLVNSGVVNGGSRTFLTSDFVVPSVASGQINYYGGNVSGGTYTMPNGNVGTPQLLASGTLASPAALSALATNPGKVFYTAGSINLTGAGTYNGTLIARGNIHLRPPPGSVITVNRVSGFPALIADGALNVTQKNITVNINGVAWLGTGMSWNAASSTLSAIRINGALLTPAATLAAATGSLTVNYTPANNDVLNLTPSVVQPPVGIKIGSWQQ